MISHEYYSKTFDSYFVCTNLSMLWIWRRSTEIKTKNGIRKLVYDFQNGNVKDNVLEYFPNEIEELLGLVEKYFMGKHGGYSRSKVLTFNMYILRSSYTIIIS